MMTKAPSCATNGKLIRGTLLATVSQTSTLQWASCPEIDGGIKTQFFWAILTFIQNLRKRCTNMMVDTSRTTTLAELVCRTHLAADPHHTTMLWTRGPFAQRLIETFWHTNFADVENTINLGRRRGRSARGDVDLRCGWGVDEGADVLVVASLRAANRKLIRGTLPATVS
jgi:hypothetical protein